VAHLEEPIPTVATDENPFVHARVVKGDRVLIRVDWPTSATSFAGRVPLRSCRTHMWVDTRRHTTVSPLIGWRTAVAGRRSA